MDLKKNIVVKGSNAYEVYNFMLQSSKKKTCANQTEKHGLMVFQKKLRNINNKE